MVEPVEAATVKMIFTWRGVDGLSVGDIRRRRVAARYPAPLGLDTERAGVWTNAVIRTILRNRSVDGDRPAGSSDVQPRM